MKFSVGELVILQNASHFSEWDGAIGEVLSPLELRNCMDMNSMETEWLQRHSVLPLVEGAFPVNCSVSQLRKLGSSTQAELEQEARLRRAKSFSEA